MALTTTPSELTATALTLTTAAQPNITSVGTLTGLTVGGHVSIAYGGGNITWGTNYPAIGNIKNSQATLLGNNIKAGATNNTIIRHANGTDAGTFIGLTFNKGVTFHTGITTTQNSEVAETTNERMRIDTSGNVGIGTTSPPKKVSISALDNGTSFGSNCMLQLIGTSTTDDSRVGLGFTGNLSVGNALAIIEAANDDQSTGNTSLHMHTYSGGWYENNLVLKAGKVGIGMETPDNKLHIKGGDWNNAHIKIERTDNGSANDPGIVFKSAAGANDAYGLGSIWFQNALDGNAYAMIRARTDDSSGTSGKIEFITSTSAVGNGSTPRMVIDGDGAFNVYSDSSGSTPNLLMNTNGIAVFTPKDNTANVAQFDTRSSGQTTGYIAFLTRGTYRGYIGNGSALSSNYNLDTDFHIRTEGGRLVFLTNGNSPKLVIDGSAGDVLPHGDGTQNLGSASKRWDNLYVNDMHFSNEGSDGNDVDGTTGNWTLQEGEEYLYVINNKSGKKFKFSLEEVE